MPAFSSFLNRTTALLFLAGCFSVPFQLGRFLEPSWLAYPVLTCCMLPVMIAFPFLKPGPASQRLWTPLILLVMVVAAGLRIVWIQRVPLTAEMGDMLPLIQLAGERFLGGGDPYTDYQLPWPLPLTFFPGLWMSYLPVVAAGMDLRWLALAAQLGTLVLMLRHTGRSSSLLLPMAFAVLPVFVVFTSNGHTPPYWWMLAGFGFAFVRGHTLTAAVCLGLAVASRQTAVVLLPSAALFWIRDLGWKRACLPLGITAGVVGAFCLPFFLRNPHGFLLAPLEHYAELAEAYAGTGDMSPHLRDTFGFANIAHVQGWTASLGRLRLLVLMLSILGMTLHAKTPSTYVAWMCLTGWALTLFTPIPWLYAYFPFWILGAFATRAAPHSPSDGVKIWLFL